MSVRCVYGRERDSYFQFCHEGDSIPRIGQIDITRSAKNSRPSLLDTRVSRQRRRHRARRWSGDSLSLQGGRRLTCRCDICAFPADGEAKQQRHPRDGTISCGTPHLPPHARLGLNRISSPRYCDKITRLRQ